MRPNHYARGFPRPALGRLLHRAILGWNLYTSFTNGMAFSPPDTMPPGGQSRVAQTTTNALNW